MKILEICGTFIFITSLFLGCSQKESGRSGQKSSHSQDEMVVDVTTLPPVDSISFIGLMENADSLVQRFILAFEKKDKPFIQKHIVNFQEHKDLYYHTPDADLNPLSADFIASLFKASNNKHLDRWLDAFEARGYKYSRHTIGPVKKEGKGFQILSDCKLWVTNKNGQEREIELFGSLLKLTAKGGKLRGYKIWSILDD